MVDVAVVPIAEARSSAPLPRLFCLVDATDDLALLPELARAGVGGFQVRAKQLGWAALCDLVSHVIGSVRPHGATVIVNDDLDAALATGADGVHLGRGDEPISRARARARGLIVGATCRSRQHVEQAARDGADYAGFGPLWASSSKPGLPEPLGPAALTPATGVLPLLGIGGVDAVRAPQTIAAGAHGVAVIGAIWRQPDPVLAAKELVDGIG